MSVASFTDAWIETDDWSEMLVNEEVASFTDAWIETSRISQLYDPEEVASFTDAWIETFIKRGSVFRMRRIFYRCVD